MWKIKNEYHLEKTRAFLALSEEIGRTIDALDHNLPKERLEKDLAAASLKVRRIISDRCCDIANLSQEIKDDAVENS